MTAATTAIRRELEACHIRLHCFRPKLFYFPCSNSSSIVVSKANFLVDFVGYKKLWSALSHGFAVQKTKDRSASMMVGNPLCYGEFGHGLCFCEQVLGARSVCFYVVQG